MSGTDSKLSEILPNTSGMSPSERLSESNQVPLYEPFYKILFVDSLVPNDYNQNLKAHLYNGLRNRESYSTLFYFGRPLWGSLLSVPNINHDNVMQMAKNKLIHSKSWDSVKNKFLASIALLSVRTTLSVNYQVFYGSELIARYMSTLFYIN